MVEIHKPPNFKIIDEIRVGMSEDEDGKNGRPRLTVERETPGSPRHERRADLPVWSLRFYRLALR
jgi:hypothetical protein